ncbi:hypothetical protein Tco_0698691 [Tanacetum coccineum]
MLFQKKGKRVLTDKDQEAVKECYKEYIGMVKIYYEEAKRSRHGEPGDVAVNCRGTAGKERPQDDARIDAEVEEMLDGTPRKKSKTARDDVKMEGNKNKRRNSRNFCGGTTQREETRLIMLLVNNESILVNLMLVDCAKTCACNDSTKMMLDLHANHHYAKTNNEGGDRRPGVGDLLYGRFLKSI